METTFPQTEHTDVGASLDIPDPLPAFDSPGLFDWLGVATVGDLNRLPFGVIAMALDGTVEAYNTAESKLANLQTDRVIGRNFFTNVAPCTNNFMVAHRFQTESSLDCVIDYVLTLRMLPKKVHMRLMRGSNMPRMFLAIRLRS